VLAIMSRTTIAVHSRDEEDVEAAHKVNSPKKQSQFSQVMMGQYWLVIKPKQAFRFTQNTLLQNFKYY